MDFLKEAWPWWAGGILIAVIMHFGVKRAKLNLRPDQLATVEAQAKVHASSLTSSFIKFAIVAVILLVVTTVLLVVFLKR